MRRRLRPLLFAAFFGLLLVTGAPHSPAQAAPDPPVPVVGISVPGAPLIGETVGIDITFSNDSASEVGYGPYVDLRLPLGADGDDGLTFADATYLGAPVARVQLVADGAGCVTHPWGVDGSGPLHVCGMDPGQAFVALRLPFGSFTPGQPTATLHVTAQLSTFADAGTDGKDFCVWLHAPGAK